MVAALVFDLLLSSPAIKHAVTPEEQSPDVPWFWMIAVIVVALVIAQVWAGCDLLKQRDESRTQFLNNRPVVEIYATPVRVTNDVVLLDVQNIGPTGAIVKRVACIVGDGYYNSYYSDDTPFPLGPAGGVNDKRGVTVTRRINGKPDFSPLNPGKEGVTAKVAWSDPNHLQEWNTEPPRFYSRETVLERKKEWLITVGKAHGIGHIFNLNATENGSWYAAVKLEANPEFPLFDPPEEKHCEIDLVLSDKGISEQWSGYAPVGIPGHGFDHFFDLAVTAKPLSVMLVLFDGGVPKVGGRDTLVLVKGHEYDLNASVMRGDIPLGVVYSYSIRVDSANHVSLVEINSA